MKITKTFSSIMLKVGRVTIIIENCWWKIRLRRRVTELFFGLEYDARFNMVKIGLGFIYIEFYVSDGRSKIDE